MPPGDPQPPQPARSRGHGWLVALLAIVVGLCAAWAVHERQNRLSLIGRVENQIRHTTFADARTADLMRLLRRPETRVIRLTASQAAENYSAVIIWNRRQSGGFIHTDLPGSLRLTAAAGTGSTPIEVARFQGAGRPVPFHLPSGSTDDIQFAVIEADAAPADVGAVLFLTGGLPDTF